MFKIWYKIGQVLAVFGGGMLGGLGRYGVDQWLSGVNSLAGTMTVNLLGCFLLTFTIYGLDLNLDLPEWEILGIGTGLVGAFTTFSTFALHFVKNIVQHPVGAVIFLIVNLVGGFACVFLGYLATVQLERRRRG